MPRQLRRRPLSQRTLPQAGAGAAATGVATGTYSSKRTLRSVPSQLLERALLLLLLLLLLPLPVAHC
jgi:hypothetical protein